MDPDKLLAELRELAMTVTLIEGHEDKDVPLRSAIELAEKFEALDEWIDKGGFLPAAWQQGR